MSTRASDAVVWSHLWDALAASSRGEVIPAPTSRAQVLDLAVARGAEGLVRLGWGERVSTDASASRSTMQRAHDALEHLDHLFFKGPFADTVFWGGEGIRGGSDVDLLILPDDEERALLALQNAGFAPAKTDLEVTAARHKARLLRPLDPSLRPLDVHVRPLNDPPFSSSAADVFASAKSYDGGLRGPSVASMIVISAGNLAGGRLQGVLRQAADAARAAQLFGVEWQATLDLARRWRATAATYGFLRLLELRLGVAVPAPALEQLRPPALVARAIERVFGAVGAPLEPESVVAGIFAVEWPLSGRRLWPAERMLRTGLLRTADKVTALSRRARSDDSLSSRSTMRVAMESRVRVPADVMMQEIDGEAVLLDLRRETYFGLDEIGTLLFRTLKSAGSLAAALDAGLAAYDVERETLTRDLLELVEELVEQGLVVVEP